MLVKYLGRGGKGWDLSFQKEISHTYTHKLNKREFLSCIKKIKIKSKKIKTYCINHQMKRNLFWEFLNINVARIYIVMWHNKQESSEKSCFFFMLYYILHTHTHTHTHTHIHTYIHLLICKKFNKFKYWLKKLHIFYFL